jgi:hypothetical protein
MRRSGIGRSRAAGAPEPEQRRLIADPNGRRAFPPRPDAALIAAADRVARRISKAIGTPDDTAEVVPLRA